MRPARALFLAVLASLALGVVPAAGDHAMPEPERKNPRCFGAAARDPVTPCRNSALTRSVFPKPIDAVLEPNSDCEFGKREGELSPCEFGVPAEQSVETIALIGDSHAAHWRAAIDHVVFDQHWHGVSMTKAGCPLSTAVSDIPEPGKTRCIKFKRQLFRWFERHPEIRTVITSNHTGGGVVGAKNDYRAHVDGYTEALRRLPPTVERIIAIRDVPRNTQNSMDCVDRAIRRKRAAGPACAIPRNFALRPDPAVIAAERNDASRVQLVDLTRFMCSSRLCLPVIGGALVHKDQTHLTRVFATSLGPYLLRHIQRAFSHMTSGTRP